MIRIGGVFSTFCQEEGILLPKSNAMVMGGVPRHFSKVSGSWVDLTLLAGGRATSVTHILGLRMHIDP